MKTTEEKLIEAIEQIRKANKYPLHSHICNDLIWFITAPGFSRYDFKMYLNRFRIPDPKMMTASVERNKLVDWISNEVNRVLREEKESTGCHN